MTGEDPARFLAAQARRLYSASHRSTSAELEAICRKRGYPVLRTELPLRGFTAFRPSLGILLDPCADAGILAHEILHAWVWENTSLGISYEPPEWEGGDEEAAANRFAAFLCSEEP